MTEEHRLEYMPLSEIRRALRNPKKHDSDGIQGSLKRFGMAELPLIDERTGLLVAGEGRVNQLEELKVKSPGQPPKYVRVENDEWLVPVVRGWASADDKEAEAYLVASNNLTLKGGWDETGLAQIMMDLQADLSGLGMTNEELDKLLRETDVLADQATAYLAELTETPTPAVAAPFAAADTVPTPTAVPSAGVPVNPFDLAGEPVPTPPAQAAPPHSEQLPPQTPTTVGATEPQWFQLTWTVTHEQREIIHEAIRVARDNHNAETAVAALTTVCRMWLEQENIDE